MSINENDFIKDGLYKRFEEDLELAIDEACHYFEYPIYDNQDTYRGEAPLSAEQINEFIQIWHNKKADLDELKNNLIQQIKYEEGV